MKTESRLLVVEMVIPPENEPSVAKLQDLEMLVITGGRERTEAEFNNPNMLVLSQFKILLQPVRSLLLCCICLLMLFPYTNIANPSDRVVLQLAWKHQFQFAGYYAALHKGYYREVGLDVVIVEGGQGRFAREEVLSGRAQYGVAGAELILHRAEGDPFVVLAPIFQHSQTNSRLVVRRHW